MDEIFEWQDELFLTSVDADPFGEDRSNRRTPTHFDSRQELAILALLLTNHSHLGAPSEDCLVNVRKNADGLALLVCREQFNFRI